MRSSSGADEFEPALVGEGAPGAEWQSIALATRLPCGVPGERAWLGAWAIALGATLGRTEVCFGAGEDTVFAHLDPDRTVAELLTGLDHRSGHRKGRYDTAFGESGDKDVVVVVDRGVLRHRTDAARARSLAVRLELALAAVVTTPGARLRELDLLTRQEREDALVGWQGEVVELPATTLPDLITETVRRVPAATALRFEGASVTYAELAARANRLAHHLSALGAGPRSVVAVAVPRSVELVVALLAVHKLAAAYLPLDRDHPRERLATVLEEARPAVVLTTGPEADLPDGHPVLALDDPAVVAALEAEPETPPSIRVAGDDPAYVIYTSGSTGRPKGVVVTHAAIVNRLLWMQSRYPLTESDRVVQKTPITFDVSVPELFGPLIAGAVLVLARPGGHRDPAYLAGLFTGEGVTCAHFVPSMLQVFLQDPAAARCASLRRISCSGEALSPQTRDRCLALLDVQLLNLYGPTEAAVEVTYWDCGGDEPGAPVPIGLPVWNTRLYVLDAVSRPVPVGVPGELYLAGAQLAIGYLNRPDLTEERFGSDPFGPPGSRMYRTGDVVRRRADGVVEYLGRADDQVKIRGFRVELGEVESVVRRAPGVVHAAVVVRPDRFGEPRIVAYPVSAGGVLDVAALRAFVAGVVPDYMVPAAFVRLDELPVTANGKLDRKRLPEPAAVATGAGGSARTEREAQLCRLFSDVLELPGIGVGDDFFALGGQSLLAVRLLSRIRTVLGADLDLATVFDAPTPAELARALDAAAPRPERRALRPASRPERVPLSAAQRGMWLLNRLEGPSATYNIPLSLTLRGPLDVTALGAALRELVTRHEILRTGYREIDGAPVQVVREPRIPLDVVRAEPAGLADRVRVEARRPFDLTRDPVVRATLFAVTEEHHVLLLVVHHIAGDGWSIRPIADDLAAAYLSEVDGVPASRPPLPIQYADYARWQAETLEPVLAEQLSYWERRLAGAPAELALPADRPRPAGGESSAHRAGLVEFTVDATVTGRLRELATRHRVTLFMVLHAGLAALLTRLGAGEDLPIGSVVAGRPDEALEELVGFFVNTLVLRTDTSGNPGFGELLDRVREADLAAFRYQDAPFDLVVERLNPPRPPGRHPLFQTMLVLQNTATAGFGAGALTGEVEELPVGEAKFDLCVTFTEHPTGLAAVLEYATDLFDEETADLLATALRDVLAELATAPDTRVGELAVPEELVGRGTPPVAEPAGTAAVVTGPPRTAQEELLLAAFRDLLGRPDIDLGGNFFEFGGYSLLAVRLVSRVRAVLGVDLTVRQLFETPTVAGLAGYLRGASGPSRPALTRQPAEPDQIPLSHAQQRLWFLNHVSGPTGTYNVPWAFRARGPLDLAALRAAVRDVVTRHEPLRTVFPDVAGVPAQRLLDPGEVTVAVVDGDADLVFRQHAGRGFDLAVDAPLRVTVIVVAPDEHVVLFVMHHIAVDGWSLNVLARDFATAYRARLGGNAPGWSELPVRYVDYTAWQDRLDTTEGLAYWRRALAGSPDTIALPTSGDRPDAPAGEVRLALGTGAHAGLQELARAHGVTLFMVLQAAVAVVLTRTGSGTDLPIGTAVAGRADDALADLVGFFVNTLVLRVDTSGEPSFAGLLERVREVDLAAYVHEDLPFDRLVEALNPHRSGTNQALFQVSVVLNEGDPLPPRLPGLVVTPGPEAGPTAKFDLAFTFTERDGLAGLVEYSTGRFDAATVTVLAECVSAVLEAVLRAPDVPIGEIDLPRLPARAAGPVTRQRTAGPEVIADPEVTEALRRLFADVLERADVDPHDNFFELGGYSLTAARLVGTIRRSLGTDVAVRTLFEAPTPVALAARLGADRRTERASSLEPVFALRATGSGTPLFCVAPAAGIGWVYSGLLGWLGAGNPVFALQSRALGEPAALGESAEEIVAGHLARIRAVRPHGPYALLGWSFGGAVAHRLAARLQAEGEVVELVSIMDGYPARTGRPRDPQDPELIGELLASLGLDEGLPGQDFVKIVSHEDSPLAGLPEDVARRLPAVFAGNVAVAGLPDDAPVYTGPVLFFLATEGRDETFPEPADWAPYVAGEFEVCEVPVAHGELTSPAALAVVGPELARRLR
ncbi:non-ribosomal peptide synthetase [Amycolatopsis sp. DSM 110486]|uniref:non-ribosomal peptide synthetase n=1 Tax=Amycolatopsis sp. DSM 110486 TaxID=2865832 RepID=UPI001C6A6BDC|nr:non-ribosomal peptide synthetase [Amycolatopsis sp. DSM 110486]QYN17777.1 amino acid adenylation domain-containing protein [Amycolatopsis sp. DSM 110486]